MEWLIYLGMIGIVIFVLFIWNKDMGIDPVIFGARRKK